MTNFCQLIWFVSKVRETAYWQPANGMVCYCEKIYNTCAGSDNDRQNFVKYAGSYEKFFYVRPMPH